jgi:hypothetical protein
MFSILNPHLAVFGFGGSSIAALVLGVSMIIALFSFGGSD